MKSFFLLLVSSSFFLGTAHALDSCQWTEAILKNDTALLEKTSAYMDRVLLDYQSEVLPIFRKVEKRPTTLLSLSENEKIEDFWAALNDARVVLHTLHSTYASSKNTCSPGIQGLAHFIRYASALRLKLFSTIVTESVWDNEIIRQKLDEANRLKTPPAAYTSIQNEAFYDFFRSDDKGGEDALMIFPPYSLVDDRNDFKNGIGPVLRDYGKDSVFKKLFVETLEKEKLLGKYKSFLNFSNWATVVWRNSIFYLSRPYVKIRDAIEIWVGDAKVRRLDPTNIHHGKTLMTIEQVNELREKMLPGDIMTSRTSWYLSNAFLPGFYPHAILYLGNATELSNYLDGDFEVDAYFSEKCREEGLDCYNLTSYLANSKHTKSAWTVYNMPGRFDGKENVILEAISEGVVFNSAEAGLVQDYLGAMRPKLSKLNKALAILEGFKNYGLPYDFDFDFRTTDKIVCSELVTAVYKTDPTLNKQGLDFDYSLEKGVYYKMFLGKVVLPAINIIQKAYDENVLKVRDSQLEFVGFIKGMEKTQNAVFSTEEEYYASRTWAKWSFLRE